MTEREEPQHRHKLEEITALPVVTTPAPSCSPLLELNRSKTPILTATHSASKIDMPTQPEEEEVLVPTPPLPRLDSNVEATPTIQPGEPSLLARNDTLPVSDADSTQSDHLEAKPLLRRAIEKLSGSHLELESGAKAVQGVRSTMEDAHVIEERIRVKDGIECHFYAVYDGHGGSRVADFAKEHLHSIIVQDDQFKDGNIESAIRSGFEKIEKMIYEKASSEKWKDGSTGIIAIFLGRRLFVANVGDSEGVLARREEDGSHFEAILLSEKHLPTNAAERTRIEQMGGFVFKGRVFGQLAVSRAFGDTTMKNPNYVSAEPHIRSIELRNDDRFLLLACDGLWDKITYAESVELVRKWRDQGKSAAEISDELVKESLTRGSLDNITVVLIFLNWR